jgi:hypothetical protein
MSYRVHIDCQECVNALYKEFYSYYNCDETPNLYDLEKDDKYWIQENHPTVYEKIKKKFYHYP